MKTLPTLFVVGALSALAGCSTTQPKQLALAQQKYREASERPGIQSVQDRLQEARKALDAANASYQRYGNTRGTRGLAYVAMRKAELASYLAADQANRAKIAALATEARALREQLARTEAQGEPGLTGGGEGQKMVFSRFPLNEATLSPNMESGLNQVAEELKENKGATATIVGHTDDSGTDAINQPLSVARAEEVRDYLVKEGADPSQLSVVGEGEHQPLDTSGTPDGQAINRRVEVLIANAPQP